MAHYCPYSPLITGEYLRVTSHELLKKQRNENVCMAKSTEYTSVHQVSEDQNFKG